MLGGFIAKIGDRLLMPATRRLANAGVPAALMNYLELASGVACATCLAQRLIPSAVALLMVHGLFDYLDGGLRRGTVQLGKTISPVRLLHTVVDKLSDVLLFLSLAWGGLFPGNSAWPHPLRPWQ